MIDVSGLQEMIRRAREFTKDRPHPNAIGCSGLFASWCDIHGTCICPRYVNNELGDWNTGEDDPLCPLHGEDPPAP